MRYRMLYWPAVVTIPSPMVTSCAQKNKIVWGIRFLRIVACLPMDEELGHSGGDKSKAATPPQQELDEVVWESDKVVSWTPPRWGVFTPGGDPGKMLERCSFWDGFVTSQCLHKCLKSWPHAPDTSRQMSSTKWMDEWLMTANGSRKDAL